MPRWSFFLAALCCGFPWSAEAHVTLLQTEAPAGSDYQALFTVDHGCGEQATTALSIGLDPRLTDVEAFPKSGWELDVVRDEGAEGVVREITWSGGRIPSPRRDFFVLRARLPAAEAGTPIYFMVVQECGADVLRWIETPLPDERPEDLAEPAPFVLLTHAP